MVKTKVSFVCQECGYDSPQWLGKCPECGNWNSFKEFHEAPLRQGYGGQARSASTVLTQADAIPKTLKEIGSQNFNRLETGFGELNTVLGGGIVRGSVVLLAGDPGIGKSTLLLQMALNVASFQKTQNTQTVSKSEDQKVRKSEISDNPSLRISDAQSFPSVPSKVLYVSGEESVEQIKLRASRIQGALENENFLLVALNNTDAIVALIAKEKPTLVIIDSIQTVESEALDGLSGSIGQVRYSAIQFIKAAKTLGIPIILVGHVTKEGMVAGPMVLSHMVDTVLFLEGEKFTATRLLRSLKNRFGPVDEVGVFAMDSGGMQEVKNPEQLFLTKREEGTPGSMLVVILEGTRPFLIEIQALVVHSKLPMPRRVAVGIDHRKLEILLAVIQKQCKLSLDTSDVFVNVAGGIKVTDPAIDLGICLSIISSLKNHAFLNTIAIAEVGLLGEIREVSALDKRIKEAKKLGFSSVISAKTNKSITSIVRDFGFEVNIQPSWQQENERKYKVGK